MHKAILIRAVSARIFCYAKDALAGHLRAFAG
jgi:hypothetical protein